MLGNAYMANGKPELALQQFEKAAALDPGNPAIKTRVAISEIGAGQGKEGLAELERVFDTQSGATIAGPTLVLTQLRAGQVDKAAQTAAALLKRDPKSALYQTLVGMVKAEQHDYPAAEAAFQAALTSQPDFSPARRDLAQLYLATGKAEQAKKVYSDALAKNPDDEAALLGLANIAIADKKWPEATDLINRARTAAPNDPAPGLDAGARLRAAAGLGKRQVGGERTERSIPLQCRGAGRAGTGPARGRRHGMARSPAISARTSWRRIRCRYCRAT